MSSPDPKSNLKRLDRLVEIRQTFVSAAEARVKEAEQQVVLIEKAAEEVARNIRSTQAEIAHVQRATGEQLQSGEKYIQMLQSQAKQFAQSLESARKSLELRRVEWTEAMRDQKIIERMQERRLQEWQRHDDVEKQKAVDENSIVRFVRTRTNPQ